MTKEQETIERLEYYLKNSAYKREDSDFFKNGGWEIVDLEIPRAIDTVLSMLKENSAEIEQKNTELAEKSAEIEKKDKINSALIDFIYKISIKQPGTVIHYLEKNGFNTSKCNNCITDNDCRKCFKQYFERKARDGRD